MRYDDVAHLLPGLVDGSVDAEPDVVDFVHSDLRCQAELVRYRRLLRNLRDLRHRYLEPDSDVLALTLEAVAEGSGPGRRHAARIAGAAAIGTTAVATAAVLIARSRRRGGLSLAG